MNVVPNWVSEYSTPRPFDPAAPLVINFVDSRLRRVRVSIRCEAPLSRRCSCPCRWGLSCSANKIFTVHLPTKIGRSSVDLSVVFFICAVSRENVSAVLPNCFCHLLLARAFSYLASRTPPAQGTYVYPWCIRQFADVRSRRGAPTLPRNTAPALVRFSMRCRCGGLLSEKCVPLSIFPKIGIGIPPDFQLSVRTGRNTPTVRDSCILMQQHFNSWQLRRLQSFAAVFLGH
jgi:hypothetical protein